MAREVDSREKNIYCSTYQFHMPYSSLSHICSREPFILTFLEKLDPAYISDQYLKQALPGANSLQ